MAHVCVCNIYIILTVKSDRSCKRLVINIKLMNYAQQPNCMGQIPSFPYCYFCYAWYIKKVKRSRYRPGVAQRVGRGIAILFHGRWTRRGWVVSSTPWPHFTPGKDPLPILQEARWVPVPVWTGGKSRPHRDSIPDRPARSSVAIPTELPGPLCHFHRLTLFHRKVRKL